MKLLKHFKGAFSKRGGSIDYTEVHAAIYGMVKGVVIYNPATLQKRTNALHMDLEQWENSEGQYSDYFMLPSYFLSKYFIIEAFGAKFPELLQLLQVIM